jgi:DNA-binding CsgD family transcriptional regulator
VTFEAILRQSMPATAEFHTRKEGPAFLNVARNLYGLQRIDYLTLNVPVSGRRPRYLHGWHAIDGIAQCTDAACVSPEAIEALDWAALKAPEGVDLRAWKAGADVAEGCDGIIYGLRTLHGELALAAVTWEAGEASSGKRVTATRDLRLLLNYFHSHLLRINGVDTSSELIMSARELDCLSWTAAGKTAWEASIILGISERTVRFHLNVAREKLNCATTTQAVAKAVSRQLIDLPA